MQSISVKAEREYSVNFVDSWNKAFLEISKSHNKVLVIAPSELASKFDLKSLKGSGIELVETPAGEAAKSPE